MKSSPKYYLDEAGAFVVENYNAAKPFSNFFPGIAGVWGVPMWVFYVNRGQGIASFGIESKDKAIMEFQPANKAYRLTSLQGFRTFLKIKKGNVTKTYEPFQNPALSSYKVSQIMRITSHDLTIEEVNTTLGLKVLVNYYTLAEEPSAGLIRHVTVQNIGKADISFELIDGLPLILPYGQNDWTMKNMCRTIEAWYKVRNMENKAPYFQLSVEPADVSQVKHVKEGHYYFAFDPKAKPGVLLDVVIAPDVVFGQSTDFIVPEKFYAVDRFELPKEQIIESRSPSAMTFTKARLKPNAEKEIISVTGFAHSVEGLNANVKGVTSKGFVAKKSVRNKEIIDEVKSCAFTNSASAEFNAYAEQTFLDNVLRGGFPISLKTNEGPAVFNVYSRKHGDLERDYNFFRLSPTYLSQGNGNYRDVNQNRRNDVWFNPDLKEGSVVNFLSLSQLDGYNPLVVCGMMFAAEDADKIDVIMTKHIKGDMSDDLRIFLQKGFMPGDLFTYLTNNNIKLKNSPVAFLSDVLGVCQKYETAQHSEGFWSDHWTYNLDLIESYLSLYPESLKHLFLDTKQFSFYQNSAYVLPREKRYVLTTHGVRQYDSVHEGEERSERGHKVRVRHGEGEVYYTNLLTKLLCVIANKAATLDPSGIGIEMEANKPNWYDSLNGLPGLLGSSISETFELKRFAQFTLEALNTLSISGDEKIWVFDELAQFLSELARVMKRAEDPLEYWKAANDVKERYRAGILNGIGGGETDLLVQDIRGLLEGIMARVDKAVETASGKDGLFPTYMFHRVTHYEWIDERQAGQEGAHVRPLEFERHDLPLFLEGFVHALRSLTDEDEARSLHLKVKKSALYDKVLKMYKVNADITSESEEIGRTRVFPRGWLENESIWLHMEYKYLLELLRRGLYQEYYEALEHACVAFQDPKTYGRSVLENSSFIASSAHKDKNFHGQGFVARLSGSTAEFVHMWMFMNAGMSPFSIGEDEKLLLEFKPALKSTFFTTSSSEVKNAVAGKKVSLPAKTYAFNFMGRTLVVYHNPKMQDTFGAKGVKPVVVTLTYAGGKKVQKISSGVVSSPYAEDVRSGQVERIDVQLG